MGLNAIPGKNELVFQLFHGEGGGGRPLSQCIKHPPNPPPSPPISSPTPLSSPPSPHAPLPLLLILLTRSTNTKLPLKSSPIQFKISGFSDLHHVGCNNSQNPPWPYSDGGDFSRRSWQEVGEEMKGSISDTHLRPHPPPPNQLEVVGYFHSKSIQSYAPSKFGHKSASNSIKQMPSIASILH